MRLRRYDAKQRKERLEVSRIARDEPVVAERERADQDAIMSTAFLCSPGLMRQTRGLAFARTGYERLLPTAEKKLHWHFCHFFFSIRKTPPVFRQYGNDPP